MTRISRFLILLSAIFFFSSAPQNTFAMDRPEHEIMKELLSYIEKDEINQTKELFETYHTYPNISHLSLLLTKLVSLENEKKDHEYKNLKQSIIEQINHKIQELSGSHHSIHPTNQPHRETSHHNSSHTESHAWPHTVQPSIHEVFQLATQITPDKYIEYFKHADCFRFIESTEHRFYEKLKEIAQNPAGKILLFRLLTALQINNDSHIKNLTIDDNKWSYSFIGKDKKTSKNSLSISMSDDIEKYVHIKREHKKEDNVSIYLFHELLHWFHVLQNEKEYNSDLTHTEFLSELQKHYSFHLKIKESDVKYFFLREWGGNKEFLDPADEEHKEHFERLRSLPENYVVKPNTPTLYDLQYSIEDKKFSFEEVLTVLGFDLIKENHPGNELSENLYRLLGGFAIRKHYLLKKISHIENPDFEGLLPILEEFLNEQIKHNLRVALEKLGIDPDLYFKDFK